MIPEALKEVLSRWDPSEVHKPDSTAPRILYTIPNGGNPTGASMTAKRKRDVYEVCVKSWRRKQIRCLCVVLLILLTHSESSDFYNVFSKVLVRLFPTRFTVFITSYMFSQLARLYDMLIIEDDPYYFLQFEKTGGSSGQTLSLRSCHQGEHLIPCGVFLQASTMHTSTFTQLMVSQLLHSWGQEGFLQHIDRVIGFYRMQRDAIISSADKWLKG
ncbi:hypothetical protein XENOCAPTIV_007453 [Xenoophorus captivus]|uniref:Uncharacterized protein n=1 Tax=Xenoophorus captivus TaxID=1517983 RepID=A0ABV0R414_9TELE